MYIVQRPLGLVLYIGLYFAPHKEHAELIKNNSICTQNLLHIVRHRKNDMLCGNAQYLSSGCNHKQNDVFLASNFLENNVLAVLLIAELSWHQLMPPSPSCLQMGYGPRTTVQDTPIQLLSTRQTE